VVAPTRRLALAAIVAGALEAGAQSPAGRAVSGAVIDTRSAPLPGLQVFVRPNGKWVLTDSAGRFTLNGLDARAYELVVRGIGFRAQVLPARLDSAETLAYKVVMERLPQDLLAVTVEAPIDSNRMRGFYARKRSQGAGRFVTRADIDGLQARRLSEILRRVPGVYIRAGSRGKLQAMSDRPAFQGSCALRVFVEGVPFQHDAFGIDDWFVPEDIEGIEVYAGGASIPPQFGDVVDHCGAMVLWLRAKPR
jgi:outer membrane receptor for Fe3+-dicitrate